MISMTGDVVEFLFVMAEEAVLDEKQKSMTSKSGSDNIAIGLLSRNI